MNVIKQLQWRYAVREFNDKIIDRKDIEELSEAVRLTASSYGLQPYKLIVIESKKIRSLLVPHAMGQNKVRDSSHLFILACQTQIDDDYIDYIFSSTENIRALDEGTLDGFKDHVKSAFSGMSEDAKTNWAQQQAYIALGNLLTVAALKEIDACPMGGFDSAGFDEVLGLKELSLSSCVICALGYRSGTDTAALAEKFRVDNQQFTILV
ncbi:NAD(P)H-dependent oxidoreductase [Alteromonadaceae bacterium BrNp21-10]|nr:NAD(P)H-dependent oxidoreductase [Alteromonadaceae bacterium BrNp21-10]